MGHAVIVNNVSRTQIGSNVDMEALRETCRQMGLNVRVEPDLSQTVSEQERRQVEDVLAPVEHNLQCSLDVSRDGTEVVV